MKLKQIRVSRDPEQPETWKIEVLESNGYHLMARLPQDEMFKLSMALIQQIHSTDDKPIIVHGSSNWIDTFFARVKRST